MNESTNYIDTFLWVVYFSYCKAVDACQTFSKLNPNIIEHLKLMLNIDRVIESLTACHIRIYSQRMIWLFSKPCNMIPNLRSNQSFE